MPVLRTAETADTEEYKYHAGAENGCSTGRKAFRIGRIYLQTGKEKIEANDYGRTIGYYSPVRGNDYVTGWLVCVKGPEKGRDYRLHHGFNRLGRSMDMDVIFRKTEAFHGIRIARLYMMGNPIIFI